jgi:hypothetical protein
MLVNFFKVIKFKLHIDKLNKFDNYYINGNSKIELKNKQTKLFGCESEIEKKKS